MGREASRPRAKCVCYTLQSGLITAVQVSSRVALDRAGEDSVWCLKLKSPLTDAVNSERWNKDFCNNRTIDW